MVLLTRLLRRWRHRQFMAKVMANQRGRGGVFLLTYGTGPNARHHIEMVI